MKFPWMQFFATDWLHDPLVSISKPATRGILMDWLCNMHLLDRSGQIVGTREQLAVLGRCTAVDVEAALSDLIQTKAADVTFRNDVVTVVNRRMKREALARKNGAIRVQRHRGNAACNGAVTGIVISQSQNHKGGEENPPPILDKRQGWQLRKDLRESTDPAERKAIQEEMRRRASVAKPQPPVPTAKPQPPKPEIPFEKVKELWNEAKKSLTH